MTVLCIVCLCEYREAVQRRGGGWRKTSTPIWGNIDISQCHCPISCSSVDKSPSCGCWCQLLSLTDNVQKA